MKILLIILLSIWLSGCSTLGGILDILSPDPVPVCDKESAGVVYKGDVCVKYSDGTYRWTAKGE